MGGRLSRAWGSSVDAIWPETTSSALHAASVCRPDLDMKVPTPPVSYSSAKRCWIFIPWKTPLCLSCGFLYLTRKPQRLQGEVRLLFTLCSVAFKIILFSLAGRAKWKELACHVIALTQAHGCICMNMVIQFSLTLPCVVPCSKNLYLHLSEFALYVTVWQNGLITFLSLNYFIYTLYFCVNGQRDESQQKDKMTKFVSLIA